MGNSRVASAFEQGTLDLTAAWRRRLPLVWRWFLIAAALGMSLRLLVAWVGYNFDIESWHITANLLLAGKSVYANTSRYNYPPTGIYLLGALKWIALRLGLDSIQ